MFYAIAAETFLPSVPIGINKTTMKTLNSNRQLWGKITFLIKNILVEIMRIKDQRKVYKLQKIADRNAEAFYYY